VPFISAEIIGLPRPCCCCRINSAACCRCNSVSISGEIEPDTTVFFFKGFPQHLLYLSPLLQGHGSLRPICIAFRFHRRVGIQGVMEEQALHTNFAFFCDFPNYLRRNFPRNYPHDPTRHLRSILHTYFPPRSRLANNFPYCELGMKAFIYKVKHDGGTGPCVQDGLLSLAICKRLIRLNAQIGGHSCRHWWGQNWHGSINLRCVRR
jgi:hypothetical protein